MRKTDRFTETLQRRLLLAIAGAAGLAALAACREEPPPPRSTALAEKPNPAAPAGPCGTVAPSQQCYAPFTIMRSIGTGQPATERPPPSGYDSNGCLPKAEVTDGCCNPAVLGPRFADQTCCYSFCPGTCCGRPFLLGGEARVAPLRPTDDWLASGSDPRPSPGAAALAAPAAAALARAWLGDAQMEHASVAAFNRFALQLLGLGAPLALVRAAQRAALDEMRHAELCFGLAAHLGGQSFGPGPMDLAGALEARALGDVLAEVIAEGCVGETTAALMAARQLEGARDPRVRRVLARVARDEVRHAELSWRFVRWATDIGGEEARARAARAFEAALAEPWREPPEASDELVVGEAWRAYGRLSAEEAEETRRRALSEIVAPCARSLLSERRSERRPRETVRAG